MKTEIKSNKVKFIFDCNDMRREFKALMLLDSPNVKQYFSLDDEEYAEAKSVLNSVVNVKNLVELGPRYIIQYLRSQDEYTTLKLYMMGEEAIKARCGFSLELDDKDEAKLYRKLVHETLLDGIEEKDIKIRLNCVRILGDEINKPKTISLIDEIEELLKDEEL